MTRIKASCIDTTLFSIFVINCQFLTFLKSSLDLLKILEASIIWIPVANPSLSKSTIKSTKSNYKVWGLRESKGNTLEEDLQNNNDTITRFLKFGQVEGIDMLVIKIPHKEYHLENLGQYKHMLKTHIQKDFIVFTKK